VWETEFKVLEFHNETSGGLYRHRVYEATEKSLASHLAPGWWKDAKLGIFIHWGLYSVPGFAPTKFTFRWVINELFLLSHWTMTRVFTFWGLKNRISIFCGHLMTHGKKWEKWKNVQKLKKSRKIWCSSLGYDISYII